jgi:hypothetical protein
VADTGIGRNIMRKLDSEGNEIPEGTFMLSIEVDNDAFQDGNRWYEVARILREVADRLEAGERDNDSQKRVPLRDVNGNECGGIQYWGDCEPIVKGSDNSAGKHCHICGMPFGLIPKEEQTSLTGVDHVTHPTCMKCIHNFARFCSSFAAALGA